MTWQNWCDITALTIPLPLQVLVSLVAGERMLKWLVTVAGREGEVEAGPAVTEDPLATLNIKKYKKREQIYSVNRWVVTG